MFLTDGVEGRPADLATSFGIALTTISQDQIFKMHNVIGAENTAAVRKNIGTLVPFDIPTLWLV